MLLLVPLDGQAVSAYQLIELLHKADIHVAGGAMEGEQKALLLFDKPEDTDRAIAFLSGLGFTAQRA